MTQAQLQLTFSYNFSKLRETNNLTQQVLADKLGVKRSRLGAWEEYRSIPSLEVLFKISNLFQVDLQELVTKELRMYNTIKELEK